MKEVERKRGRIKAGRREGGGNVMQEQEEEDKEREKEDVERERS